MNASSHHQGRTSSLRIWRKFHRYSFGYFRWLSLIVSIFLLVCTITGVLYNHQHDFAVLEKSRISTAFLPDSYQERLDRTRKAQGLEHLFPEEANSVPVMWVIKDLHTGAIFGFWGRIFYDLLGIMLVILTVTGCYLYLARKPRPNRPRKDP